MYEVKDSTYKKAYKPFDVVETKDGSVGMITEVSINDGQESFHSQVSYAVEFFIEKSTNLKHAWWDHNELKVHSNVMVVVAKSMCHPAGGSYNHYDKLLGVNK